MKMFFKKLIDTFLMREKDPRKLAFTTCLGLFIGCSPFLGLQTPLVFALGYLFNLSIPILFSVVYLVNNPFFTTIPILIANYLVGYLLFTYILPWNVCGANPSWFSWIEKKISPLLSRILGPHQVCFWYFIVGGVVFAILVSVPFYPILKRLYAKLVNENNSTKQKSIS